MNALVTILVWNESFLSFHCSICFSILGPLWWKLEQTQLGLGFNMSFGREHDLHKRRKGRNLGLGLVLIGFVGIMFGLTVVKVTEGQFAEALAGVSRSE